MSKQSTSQQSADECAPKTRVPDCGVASAQDPVDPDHYKLLSPEPRDVVRSWGLNFNLGNVVKYAARAGRKDPTKYVEDLKKARSYLEHEIAASETITIGARDFDVSDCERVVLLRVEQPSADEDGGL